MQLILDTFKNTGAIHHAYCIEGDKLEILPILHKFLEDDFKFKIIANPDLLNKTSDTFTIDDSREVKEFHLCKSFGESGKKVFIICANFITREAQNALLKIFEEPSSGNYFFIITPSSEILLPTLRSRLAVVSASSENSSNKEARLFIKSGISERLAMIKVLTESISDDEKSKMDALLFVNGIEKEFINKRNAIDLKLRDTMIIEELEHVRDYLGDRAPSVKMLLEHIALIL